MKFITTILFAVFMTFSANSQELNLEWQLPNGSITAVASDDTHFYISGNSTAWASHCSHGFKVTTGSDRYDEKFPYVYGVIDYVEADGDKGWIIAGLFGQVGKTKVSGLARISIDGKVDSKWNPLKGYNLSSNSLTSLLTTESNCFVGFNGDDDNSPKNSLILKIDRESGAIDESWTIPKNIVNNFDIAKGTFYYDDCIYVLITNGETSSKYPHSVDKPNYILMKVNTNLSPDRIQLLSLTTQTYKNKNLLIEIDTSAKFYYVFTDSIITKYSFIDDSFVNSFNVPNSESLVKFKIDNDLMYLFYYDSYKSADIRILNKNSYSFVDSLCLYYFNGWKYDNYDIGNNPESAILFKDDYIYMYSSLLRFNKTTGISDSTWKPNPYGRGFSRQGDMDFNNDTLYFGNYYSNRINQIPTNGLIRVNKSDNRIDTAWKSIYKYTSNLIVANDFIYFSNYYQSVNVMDFFKVSNPIQRIDKNTGLIDGNWKTNLVTALRDSLFNQFYVEDVEEYMNYLLLYVQFRISDGYSSTESHIFKINKIDGSVDTTWDSMQIPDSRIEGMKIYKGVLYYNNAYLKKGEPKSKIRGINLSNDALVLDVELPSVTSFDIANDNIYYCNLDSTSRIDLNNQTITKVIDKSPNIYYTNKLIVQYPYIFLHGSKGGIDFHKYNLIDKKFEYDSFSYIWDLNNFFINSNKLFLSGDIEDYSLWNRYSALIFDLDSNKQMVKQVAPKDDSTNTPHKLVFTWKSLYFANTYQIQISEDIEFDSTFFDSSVYGTEKYVTGLVNDKTYYWRVRALFGSDSTVWSDIWSFTTDAVISVPEETEIPSRIRLYPNPANEMLNIVLPEFSANQYFEIVDISGRKLQSGYLSGISTEINISHLPKGVYFIKADDETVKFIKE